jgi:hypothetical protein
MDQLEEPRPRIRFGTSWVRLKNRGKPSPLKIEDLDKRTINKRGVGKLG